MGLRVFWGAGCDCDGRRGVWVWKGFFFWGGMFGGGVLLLLLDLLCMNEEEAFWAVYIDCEDGIKTLPFFWGNVS
jgi:hypothetical protein